MTNVPKCSRPFSIIVVNNARLFLSRLLFVSTLKSPKGIRICLYSYEGELRLCLNDAKAKHVSQVQKDL